MRTQPLRSLHSSYSGRTSVLDRVASRLHGAAVAVGFVLRFTALSILAFLLVSTPISLREVPYASHRPSPSH